MRFEFVRLKHGGFVFFDDKVEFNEQRLANMSRALTSYINKNMPNSELICPDVSMPYESYMLVEIKDSNTVYANDIEMSIYTDKPHRVYIFTGKAKYNKYVTRFFNTIKCTNEF